jgi:predicted ATP-grasp superfamily ATP-dependent carboligase
LSATPVSHSPDAWLLKPRRSGGGHGIRRWLPGEPVPRSKYLQEQVEGIAGSITFVADGYRTVPLGLTLQLVGEEWLGSSGYRYCGNLLSGGPSLFPREAALRDAAEALAAAVTDSFALVGVNGIDFIARDGTPWLLEVNPRFSASMELVEREHRVSIFALHAAACRGALPARSPYCRRLRHVAGKAIVYARRTSTVRPAAVWDGNRVADVPHPGELVAVGRPICTVFARGSSARQCRVRLADLAASVYRAAGTSKRSVA